MESETEFKIRLCVFFLGITELALIGAIYAQGTQISRLENQVNQLTIQLQQTGIKNK